MGTPLNWPVRTSEVLESMHLDVLRCLAVKPAMVRICGKASELHPVSHTWLQFANDGVEAMRRFGDSMGVISAVNRRMESSGHPLG
jgi:hypothetical protein